MSDEKKLSDRLRSYLYSMHPIMLSVGELFRYADEIADLEQRLEEAEQEKYQPIPSDGTALRELGKRLTELLDADHFNAIEHLLFEIGADRQAAIDAALESLKTSCRKCEYDEADGSLIDHCPDCQRKIVTALYAIKGTNPLAEAQARIAELERELAEAKRRADWFENRCNTLQLAQTNMRDPERKMVCDILANGKTYETLVKD